MAAGTETVYKLDLEDIIAFPDSGHIPVLPPAPGESWIIFGEIVRDESFVRPVFWVKDKIDCQFPVAFYTDNPRDDAKECRIGRIMCIKNGMRHQFFDGTNGYRIEDPSTVFVLPCSMSELRAMNQRLRDKSDRGEFVLCNICKKPAENGCSKCNTTRYCSTECQANDWKQNGHRRECSVLARLHIWNRTDWG
ncbi:hypothetical protein C8J57DRAFT_1320588 [Mycena rebaudengoi]|nr:hypothetical protein C8J57DRAFT_1320588 [Mycena rebaudengoi]